MSKNPNTEFLKLLKEYRQAPPFSKQYDALWAKLQTYPRASGHGVTCTCEFCSRLRKTKGRKPKFTMSLEPGPKAWADSNRKRVREWVELQFNLERNAH